MSYYIIIVVRAVREFSFFPWFVTQLNRNKFSFCVEKMYIIIKERTLYIVPTWGRHVRKVSRPHENKLLVYFTLFPFFFFFFFSPNLFIFLYRKRLRDPRPRAGACARADRNICCPVLPPGTATRTIKES